MRGITFALLFIGLLIDYNIGYKNKEDKEKEKNFLSFMIVVAFILSIIFGIAGA